jgi:hypothetical protein
MSITKRTIPTSTTSSRGMSATYLWAAGGVRGSAGLLRLPLLPLVIAVGAILLVERLTS